jgi:hypothetical protein
MGRLLVLQSLWAMERRHSDGLERSLDTNVAMTAQAGFGGVSALKIERNIRSRAASMRPPIILSRRRPFESLETFGSSGLDDMVRDLLDTRVPLRRLENLRSVTHDHKAIAHHERMIEIVGDEHA